MTASAVTDVSVSWNAVPGASKYAVGYKETSASNWTSASDNITGTSYTIASLDCGTEYNIGVRAQRAVANLPAAWSAWAETNLTTASCDAFGSAILQLGDTSAIWQVPSGVANVYLDVALSDNRITDTNAGYIRVQELDYRGEYVDVKEVRTSADTGPLTGVSGGDTLRIKVDPDVFDDSAAEVYLTFHNGRGINTPVMAKATLQKQQRPNAPTNPTASVNASTGAVSLSWIPGVLRPQASPHHYGVEIASAGSSPVSVYTHDSVTARSLQIDNAWDRGFAGDLQVKVKHCNSVGGCSVAATYDFTQPPFDVSPGFKDENVDDPTYTALGRVGWNILEYGEVYLETQGLPSDYEYRIESTSGTGLQTGRQACNWSAWPSGFSSWADTDAFTQVVRCEMGDGSTDFKVWTRSKTSGLQFKTPSYQRNLGLPWHVADEELTYHLTTPWIPDATSTVSAADQQTYSDSFDQAIAAWNAVQSASPASDSFAIATPALSSPTTANLVVRGHQTPTTNATDPCGNYEYIACVVLIGSGNYPHMGQQYLYFDSRPHGKMYNRTWTTSFSDARMMDDMFLHVTLIMTHEFGHAAGLWHDSTSGNTMYRGVVGVPPTGSDLLKEGDIKALLSIYDNHTVNN